MSTRSYFRKSLKSKQSSFQGKRVVTSALPGISVSDVRRLLDTVRKQWKEQSDEKPFCIFNLLNDEITIQEFCYAFVDGNHKKRHQIKRTSKCTNLKKKNVYNNKLCRLYQFNLKNVTVSFANERRDRRERICFSST